MIQCGCVIKNSHSVIIFYPVCVTGAQCVRNCRMSEEPDFNVTDIHCFHCRFISRVNLTKLFLRKNV